jgi:hypothetical protein
MCAKCIELDDRIAHYDKLARLVTDQRTLEGIASLTKEMKDEKVELHPKLKGK